jgi:hypothetical protein
MKTAGIILSICVTLASIPFFLMIRISTFETWPPERRFEIEPPEGYDYWERIEFWDDVQDFSIYGGSLLAITLSPVIGLILLFRQPSRKFGQVFMTVSLLLSLIPLWLMIDATHGGNFTFFWLLLLVLFCGCIYGAGAASVAMPSKIGTQQDGDLKPDHAAS